MVAVYDEIVSGPIADFHPQLAKRKDEPQPASQKQSGCISKTKRTEHQSFPKKWLARYPWIQFTESDGNNVLPAVQAARQMLCVGGRDKQLLTKNCHRPHDFKGSSTRCCCLEQ